MSGFFGQSTNSAIPYETHSKLLNYCAGFVLNLTLEFWTEDPNPSYCETATNWVRLLCEQ